jgi:ribonuclease HI
MSEQQHITIYTDGACIGNPGPGGYGVVLRHGTYRKELTGGFRLTTNNRMEIMAAIIGLRALKRKCTVTVYTDSQYVVDSIMKGWAQRWQVQGWKRNKKERAINPDLWEQLLTLCAQHNVRFEWIRGHAGNVENERCDYLSMQAARQPDLLVDTGYEQPEQPIILQPSLFD